MIRSIYYRVQARRKLAKVPAQWRELAREVATQCANKETNLEDVERAAERKLTQGDLVGLDPLTILAIIQAVLAVWKFLREIGVLGETTVATVKKEVL